MVDFSHLKWKVRLLLAVANDSKTHRILLLLLESNLSSDSFHGFPPHLLYPILESAKQTHLYDTSVECKTLIAYLHRLGLITPKFDRFANQHTNSDDSESDSEGKCEGKCEGTGSEGTMAKVAAAVHGNDGLLADIRGDNRLLTDMGAMQPTPQAN